MSTRFFKAAVCALLTMVCLWGCLPEVAPLAVSSPRSSCWPATRAAYLRDHPVCEACGGRDGLQVHHCVPFNTAEGKLLECDQSNLITLCTADTHNDHLWIGHAGTFNTYNPNVREDAKRFREMLANRRLNK